MPVVRDVAIEEQVSQTTKEHMIAETGEIIGEEAGAMMTVADQQIDETKGETHR